MLISDNMVQARVFCEEGPSVEKLPPSDWPMGMAVGNFLDCQLMEESLTHCRCTKLAKHMQRASQISSLSMMDYLTLKPNKSFSPCVGSGQCYMTAAKSKLEQLGSNISKGILL